MAKRLTVFLCSVFFVLGFSFVFALLGVLLQTVLSDSSYSVQKWLGRIGGAIIILFGLYLIGLIRPAFLDRDYKIQVKRKFNSRYLTPFVAQLFLSLGSNSFGIGQSLNMFIAFVAGLISFLSPCVLPLIPAFLGYLAST